MILEVSAVRWWRCPCSWRGNDHEEIGRHLQDHGGTVQTRMGDLNAGVIEDWCLIQSYSLEGRAVVGDERNRYLLNLAPKVNQFLDDFEGRRLATEAEYLVRMLKAGSLSKEQVLAGFDLSC